MRRPLVFRVGLVFLAALLAAPLVPDVRWALWGWLHGQAFYRGRPTSYWAGEVGDWLVANDWGCIPLLTPHTLPDVLGYAWTDRLEKSLGIPPRVGADASRLWEGDAAAVPVLIQLLRCDDSAVAAEAASALGRIGPHARPAVPALTEALDVTGPAEVHLRASVAEALGRIGPDASTAAPALRRASADEREHVDVRRRATEALRQVIPGAAAQPGVP